MADVTFDEVLKLARQLPVTQQAELVERLRVELELENKKRGELMLARIKAEHQRRLDSGAFEQAKSLRNYWANPDIELTEEQLEADLHEITTEWESEIDEFFGDD